MTRIVILGGPKTGKTTLANRIASLSSHGDPYALYESGSVLHTDSVIHLGWSEASQAASLWFDEPGPWIIEGVAAVRALRKWRDQHPGAAPPVDRAIMLTHAHGPLGAGQSSMTKGVWTVLDEIKDWLEQHAVRVEYLRTVEIRCEHPGYNGIARLDGDTGWREDPGSDRHRVPHPGRST